jgi:uncharacterized protein
VLDVSGSASSSTTACCRSRPPGTGKTFTGAHMILALVKAGKRIGISAVSHRYRTLLRAVCELAEKQRFL